MADESFKSEYQKIEDVLSKSSKYRIPPYQRDYSWEKNDQIADFWNDLTHSVENNRVHYFGAILLKKNDEDSFEILDGQQRLVTVTILLAVIRDKLYDLGDHERALIVQQAIAITDEKTLKPKERLELNLRNKSFFLDYIQRMPSDKNRKLFTDEKLSNTNKLIKEAYEFFKKEIDNVINTKPTKDSKIDYLTNISTHTKGKLGIIKTVVTSYTEAYRLFIPLNFRGLELSVADLFKTHIIGEAPDEKKDEVIKIWDNIVTQLDEAGVVTFLRHYWASKFENVTANDLYDKFTEHLEKEKKDVVTVVKELSEEAETYGALFNPSSDSWKDKGEIQRLISDITTLNLKQSFPLLLSGRKKFGDKDFEKLLRACITLSFRNITIAGFNNKDLERLYSEVAINVRSDKNYDINKVVTTLKQRCVDDDTLIPIFNTKQIQTNKVARYILTKIEDYLSPEQKEKVSKIITLEHIISESTQDAPDKISLVYRLGNMTLLTEKMNRAAQNKSFIKKRDEHYKKSNLKINEPLKNRQRWTAQEVNDRQKWLTDTAIKIWKFN